MSAADTMHRDLARIVGVDPEKCDWQCTIVHLLDLLGRWRNEDVAPGVALQRIRDALGVPRDAPALQVAVAVESLAYFHRTYAAALANEETRAHHFEAAHRALLALRRTYEALDEWERG